MRSLALLSAYDFPKPKPRPPHTGQAAPEQKNFVNNHNQTGNLLQVLNITYDERKAQSSQYLRLTQYRIARPCWKDTRPTKTAMLLEKVKSNMKQST